MVGLRNESSSLYWMQYWSIMDSALLCRLYLRAVASPAPFGDTTDSLGTTARYIYMPKWEHKDFNGFNYWMTHNHFPVSIFASSSFRGKASSPADRSLGGTGGTAVKVTTDTGELANTRRRSNPKQKNSITQVMTTAHAVATFAKSIPRRRSSPTFSATAGAPRRVSGGGSSEGEASGRSREKPLPRMPLPPFIRSRAVVEWINELENTSLTVGRSAANHKQHRCVAHADHG